jgi:inhibitor of KinA sporulation pathway (predicted exonuclease)
LSPAKRFSYKYFYFSGFCVILYHKTANGRKAAFAARNLPQWGGRQNGLFGSVKNKMNYIVMDLEWNQPMSRQNPALAKIGAKLPFEIFQIGAVKLNERFEQVDTFQVVIKLRYYKKLHYMVKKLTGVKEQEIADGLDFIAAVSKFYDWCGERFTLLTWGYDDIPILSQNLEFYGLDASWCERWYNLQVIFNKELAQGKNQRSLEYALDYFGIPQEGRLHDALNDACYTAQVAQRLDMQNGLSAYEKSVWDMRPKKFTEVKRMGVFAQKRKAMGHPKVSRICCPVCGKELSHRVRWRPTGSGDYRTEVTCKTHGDFVGILKFSRCEDGWQVTRTVNNKKKVSGAVPAPVQQVQEPVKS